VPALSVWMLFVLPAALAGMAALKLQA